MIIRRTLELTTGLCFAALAVTATLATTACTQAVDSTGASSNAVGGTASGASATDEAGRPLRPRFLLADVVDDRGSHALVPFALPAPKDGAAPKDGPPLAEEGAPRTPPPCIVHRTSADDPPMMPPPPRDPKAAGAPPGPPPEKPAGDEKPGPLMLQIAVFASEADARVGAPMEGAATKLPPLPVIVVQCFGAPGDKRVDVPQALLDDAFAGLADGATARIALAGFPMPPPPPKDGATPMPPAPTSPPSGASGDAPMGPPPPPMGRGVFAIAKVSDTSKIDSLLTTLALP